MSLTCAECGAVNADGRAFCTGCGVSLALAITSGPVAVPAPVATVPRNPFPEEPGRVSGGSGALPWVLVGVLVLLVAAVAGTGRWAFQRTSEPDAPVPVTIVEPAPLAEDTAAPADAAMDAALPATETLVAEPPPPIALPPVVAPPRARAVQAPRPRPPAHRVADDENDDEPAPRRSAARPVGPVGGGPASACYGRSGALLDTCIRAQCRQPHYRNHPACHGD